MARTAQKESAAAPPEGKRRPLPAAERASLPDDELLDIRLCDLELPIEGTELERNIAQLYAELDACGIRFRPYFWFSNEWFTPDDVPGIAVPFYLAHPRLRPRHWRQRCALVIRTRSGYDKIRIRR